MMKLTVEYNDGGCEVFETMPEPFSSEHIKAGLLSWLDPRLPHTRYMITVHSVRKITLEKEEPTP